MKLWRLLVPAVLIIVYGALLLYIIAGVTLELPDFSKSPYLVSVIVPAALYYIAPLRTWINKSSHERISENLRAGMVAISGYSDDPEKYSWKNLRSLFFKLVDDDKTLSTKASLAYFNGLIWTGFADSAAIAVWYGLLSAVLVYFNAANALWALVAFFIIFIVSIVGNRVTTSRQISIGNEQLEHMKFEYKAAIEKRLIQLDE